MRRHAEAHTAAHLGHLHDGGDVFEIAEAGTTVLLGHQYTQHSRRTEVVLQQVDGQVLGLIPLHDVGTQLSFAQVTHGLCDHRLTVGGVEFHVLQ